MCWRSAPAALNLAETDISQLKPEQHARLEVQLNRQVTYAERLAQRLTRLRLARDSEFIQAATRARDATNQLWLYVATHRPMKSENDLPFQDSRHLLISASIRTRSICMPAT